VSVDTSRNGQLPKSKLAKKSNLPIRVNLPKNINQSLLVINTLVDSGKLNFWRLTISPNIVCSLDKNGLHYLAQKHWRQQWLNRFKNTTTNTHPSAYPYTHLYLNGSYPLICKANSPPPPSELIKWPVLEDQPC